MFTPHPFNRDASVDRAEVRRRLEIDAGTRSETFGIPCSYMPGDGVNVLRVGAKANPASVVMLQAVSGPASATVHLTAVTARRLAAHLLNFADDLDEPTHVDIVDRAKGGAL